jgi:uncharacterized membrane protein
MTSKLDIGGPSEGDRVRARLFLLDFAPGVIGYLAVLAAVVVWGHLDGQSAWRHLWAVLPVVPALWVVRAVGRHIGRVDEYQRLLMLKGIAGGLGVAMIVAITMGFLGIAGLRTSPPITGWIVYSAGMAGWIVSGAVAGALRRSNGQ